MPDQDLIESVSARIRAAKPGARMPSARQLAEQFKVSRAQMNAAIERLLGAGALRREGRKLYAGVEQTVESFTVHIFSSDEKHLEPARAVVERMGGTGIVHFAAETAGLRKPLIEEVKPSSSTGLLMWFPRHLDLLEKYEQEGVAVVLCGDRWPGHSYVTGNRVWNVQSAVDHLVALGHREISLVIRETKSLFDNLVEDFSAAYHAACLGKPVEHRADEISVVETDRDMDAFWQRWLESATHPSALICSDPALAKKLMDLAIESGVRIPEDLSFIAVGDNRVTLQCDPPLTTVDIDQASMSALGAFLLCQELRRRQNNPRLRLRQAIECEPLLTVRGSTAPPRKASGLSGPAQAARWSDDETSRRGQADAINRRSHPDLPGPGGFRTLDLTPLVNRGFTPRSAWLGDQPLRHFKPGAHTIHGVPFVVALGPERRNSAIVLRSRKVHRSGDQDLPELVEVAVGGRVRSVFLLHAAGWIVRHEAFARYEFCFEDGREAHLPVIPFARGPDKEADAEQWLEESTVQDWHPSNPRFANSRALPFLITKNGDPLLYERYLYTCRWVNPHPELPLKSIRIRSLEPDSRATLAVLAITCESRG